MGGYCSLCAKRLTEEAVGASRSITAPEGVVAHPDVPGCALTVSSTSSSIVNATDSTWIAACLGAATGDVAPVHQYIANGGIVDRPTVAGDCTALGQMGIWLEPGRTLLDIALERDCAVVVMALMEGMQPGISEDTQEFVRRNLSTLVEDDFQRTTSFLAAFGEEDAAAMPNVVREILLTARNTRADGLSYLELESLPCSFSFFLPAEVAQAPEDVRRRALGLLVEAADCLEALEAAVGWWPSHSAACVVPLYTSADLNCLLHACSLALAGVRDTLTIPQAEGRCLLRELLYASLANCPSLQKAALCPAGVGGEERLQEVLSSAKRNRTALDGSHMFALANTLRRPLICHAAVDHEGGEARHILEVPFRMSGVYLPLMWDPAECSTNPLVVAYTRGHFTALCPVRPEHGRVAIPLYDAEAVPLPVPFAVNAQATESGAQATESGGWMGWAGAPPEAAAGALCRARGCSELLMRYLLLEERARGTVAMLCLPDDAPANCSTPDETPGTKMQKYCHLIGSLVQKKLRHTPDL